MVNTRLINTHHARDEKRPATSKYAADPITEIVINVNRLLDEIVNCYI